MSRLTLGGLKMSFECPLPVSAVVASGSTSADRE